jgi:hypothetical protein
MRLYTFGSSHLSRPDPVLRAHAIRVLWASWCDVLLACRDAGDDDNSNARESWHLEYHGTGLRQSQQDFLHSGSPADRLARAIASLSEGEGHKVVFFGSTLHHGLQGYVLTSSRDSAQEVVLFATDHELQSPSSNGVHDVQTYHVGGSSNRRRDNDTLATIIDVKMQSDESMLLLLGRQQGATSRAFLAHVKDIPHLRTWLYSGAAAVDMRRVPYDPHAAPQWVSNATTTTVLDSVGHVWTSSSDARYQACLGRPYLDGVSEARAIPYLEETCVTRVVSGGYMTAALSGEGELFLWGQACPGSPGEMDVLNGKADACKLSTGISVEGDPDEFVKCLDVRINGQEARVYHVAIGHGHVLVAAESEFGSAK